jgi:predicted transcriptional regulator
MKALSMALSAALVAQLSELALLFVRPRLVLHEATQL